MADKRLSSPDIPVFGTIDSTDLIYGVKDPGGANTQGKYERSLIDDRYVVKTGDTMSGQLNFSGTDHAGLKLLSLTTAERDALTPAAGMLIYNETASEAQIYTSSWGSVGGGAVDSVFGRVGAVVAAGGDYTASEVTNVAAGSIVATDVQAAINELDVAKQPIDANLTAIAALTPTDGNFIVGNGSAWVAESGATARTSLGLGSAAESAATDFLSATGDDTLSGGDLTISNPTTARLVLEDSTAGSNQKEWHLWSSVGKFALVTRLDGGGNPGGSGLCIEASKSVSGDIDYLRFLTGSNVAEAMRIDTNQDVVIGSTDPLGYKLRVHGGDMYISGANQLRMANTTSDSTLKYGRFTVGHYDNSEEAVLGFQIQSEASASFAAFGGSSSIFNAVTNIRFYTAANNITLTGTERARITSTGLGLGTTTPDTRLDIADGALTFSEMTPPSSPAANGGVLYLDDNGAGKTRLMCLFSTGAAQQVAIEP